MPSFSTILRQANTMAEAPAAAQHLRTEVPEEATGPLRAGRVKSFSQKSGWGFIQLFETKGDNLETSKDVFFHRADVARAGPMELRPGMLVQCRVVSTGKGEKASGIALLEVDERPEGMAGAEPAAPEVAAAAPHDATPAAEIPSDPADAVAPINMPTSAYSLRGTDHRIRWDCTRCTLRNFIPGRLRVMVVCASCRHAHAVQGWVCCCGQANKRDSRHCTGCDRPQAMVCEELVVHLAQETESQPLPQETAMPPTVGGAKRTQLRRSRWSHTAEGWAHPTVEASMGSAWLQDPTPVDEKRGADASPAALLARHRDQLLWARNWLLKGAPAMAEDDLVTPDWLYRFSEEVAGAQHHLLCPTRGYVSFVPNPCANVEDANVLRMYEALGTVLGLALVARVPLHPVLPTWMARSLLGYPTLPEDLGDLDPALLQKAELVAKHPNVEALGLTFTEEITRFGVTRFFKSAHLGPQVTAANKRLYGLWLKEVHLHLSIEAQMKAMQSGFLAALLASPLRQGVTPEEMSHVINGERTFDVAGLRASLKVGHGLHAVPMMEDWMRQAALCLTARQWQLLLRLVTGFAKTPCDGLASLDPPLTVNHDPRLPLNSFPIADKRTHQLVLPPYSSPDALHQCLMAALGNQPQGFSPREAWAAPAGEFPRCQSF